MSTPHTVRSLLGPTPQKSCITLVKANGLGLPKSIDDSTSGSNGLRQPRPVAAAQGLQRVSLVDAQPNDPSQALQLPVPFLPASVQNTGAAVVLSVPVTNCAGDTLTETTLSLLPISCKAFFLN